MTIPHEINDKIHEMYPSDLEYPTRQASRFGYNLAAAELEAKDKLIADLKSEIEFQKAAVEVKGNRVKELEEMLRELLPSYKAVCENLGYKKLPLYDKANQLLNK